MVKVLAINENDDPSSMSYHFKKLILDAGYPVMKVFAQENSISYSTLSRYTSGSASNPTLDFLVQMQKALELPMDTICNTHFRAQLTEASQPVDVSTIPLITRPELTRWPDNQEQIFNTLTRKRFVSNSISPEQKGFALELSRNASRQHYGVFRLHEAGENLAPGSYRVLLSGEHDFSLVTATIDNDYHCHIFADDNRLNDLTIKPAEIHSLLVSEIIEHI